MVLCDVLCFFFLPSLETFFVRTKHFFLLAFIGFVKLGTSNPEWEGVYFFLFDKICFL
ncbi:hypothetical protein C2G38_2117390, partial [Gigaspora rosea]